MEEDNRPTPVQTPETSAPGEVTPAREPLESRENVPLPIAGGEEGALAVLEPAVAERVASGMISPIAMPVNAADPSKGDIAAIPCLIEPVAHGYIICRVDPDPELPVLVMLVPPLCKQEHPPTPDQLDEYALRARAAVVLTATSRRHASTATAATLPPEATADESREDE